MDKQEFRVNLNYLIRTFYIMEEYHTEGIELCINLSILL